MRLLTRPTERPRIKVAGSLTPRQAAIRLLAEKIEDGQAGLDPFDARVFIVELGPNEAKWGTLAVCLTGWPTNRVERPDGTVRLYAVVEADARLMLGLDSDDPPLMMDEALASRGVDAAGVAMDRMLEALPAPVLLHAAEDDHLAALQRLRDKTRANWVELSRKLALADAESDSALAAIREAKAAYDRRYPNGAQPA